MRTMIVGPLNRARKVRKGTRLPSGSLGAFSHLPEFCPGPDLERQRVRPLEKREQLDAEYGAELELGQRRRSPAPPTTLS